MKFYKKKPLFFTHIIATIVCELVDLSVYLFPCSLKKKHRNKKQVLIIFLGGIGDFILFLDALKEYGKLYPKETCEITLIGNNLWKDIAERLHDVNRFLAIEVGRFEKNPFYRFCSQLEIKKQKFDVVINPTYSRKYILGDSIARISRSSERIGSSGDLSNIHKWMKWRSDGWYTKLIPSQKQIITELERNAEFLRGLGLTDFQKSVPIYPLDVLPNIQPELIDLNLPYFMISPGAGWVGRRWPENYFAEVAILLYEKTGWIPVLCGGLEDEPLAMKIISSAHNLPWQNLAGKVSLIQLLAILGRAKLIIGNESSTVHMASAVACPVVCIIGGGHFGRFFPYGDLDKNRIVFKTMDCYGCNWQCIYPNVRCVEEIPVNDVFQEALSMIDLNMGTANHC